MGWASGSRLMSRVIEVIESAVTDFDARKAAYVGLIDEFEESDWDTQDECMGESEAFDAAMNEVHPGWFDGDD
jgi:hypothetical protein